MSGITYDHIIIGGGTAGVIMAARLSEDPACQVLLLEAGPDYADPAEVPSALLDSNVPVTAGHNWDLQALRRQQGLGGQLAHLGRVAKVFEVASNRLAMARSAPALLMGGGDTLNRMNYPMARVMGGGSAVNGALALHAREHDFDNWSAAGNDFWRWDQVRPWIERFEQDEPARAALPVETPRPAEYTQLQRAFAQACAEMNLAPAVGPGAPGVQPIPKSTRASARASTASIYLDQARARPNLRIIPHCLVDRIVLEQRDGSVHASGVDAVLDGGLHRWRAHHVVLAAGAIHSPAILLRSGVGESGAVRQLGVPAMIDAPGVGRNLQDHPVVSLWGVPAEGSFRAGEPIHQLMLEHLASGSANSDLQLLMLSAVPTAQFPPLDDFVGAPTACGITVMLARPASTGTVELPYRDPQRAPRIVLNCLQQEQDMRRVMEGVRLAWRILQAAPLRGLTSRFVMWNQTIIDSDKLLANAIETTVRAAWHPVGTLRMGPDGDRGAVVDQYGALRGCDNVTVADASIMPSIPSVPTNLTCMLIAEKLAAMLADSHAMQLRRA